MAVAPGSASTQACSSSYYDQHAIPQHHARASRSAQANNPEHGFFPSPPSPSTPPAKAYSTSSSAPPSPRGRTTYTLWQRRHRIQNRKNPPLLRLHHPSTAAAHRQHQGGACTRAAAIAAAVAHAAGARHAQGGPAKSEGVLSRAGTESNEAPPQPAYIRQRGLRGNPLHPLSSAMLARAARVSDQYQRNQMHAKAEPKGAQP